VVDCEFMSPRSGRLSTWAALVVACGCVTAGTLVAQSPALRVDVASGRSLSFSLDDFRSMPRNRATVDRQGGMVTYEGVRLVELLRRAGLDVGRAPLQGAAVTSVLVAAGADGYEAVFALAELDPVDAQARVLIADTRDGRSLTADEGPLRLVAPGDRYPVRWLRNVVRVTVLPAPKGVR
jgi:hypothetical protein